MTTRFELWESANSWRLLAAEHVDDATATDADCRRTKSSGTPLYAINDFNAIIDCMASITIRNLKETTKRKLKVRAAIHGRSMEQEAREILNTALRQKTQKPKSGAELVKQIRAIWEPLGGVDLEPLPREPMRDPDWLKDWK